MEVKMKHQKLINQVKKVDIENIDVTPDIIGEALYLLTRQSKKTELYDEALEKAIQMKWADIVGYYTRNSYEIDGKIYKTDKEQCWEVIQIKNFQLYRFNENDNLLKKSGINCLGEIVNFPPTHRSKNISSLQAVALLLKFLNN